MPKKWWWRRPDRPTLWIQGVLVILVLGAFTTPARAHRILVFAYAEGDVIHTESTFVPATPVRQGKVMVLEEKSGQVLLTGQTDDQGKFTFKIPPEAAAQKLDLKIVVEAAMGHRGEWLLKAASYVSGATPGKAAAPAAPAPAATPGTPAGKTANLDPQMLEAALNKALERQLAPIKERLTELTIHRTSLADVIGGIGYILGIFGLWAYFQSKRKQDS